MKLNMAEDIQVFPILAIADITTTATATSYVNLAKLGMGQLEIEVNFGAITPTDATGECVVTVEANAVNDTSSSDNDEGAIAFNYRLSSAAGTDSMGALTAAASTGKAISGTDDNKTLLVYVDPAVAAKKFVRAVLTPTADMTTTCVVGAVARFVPRKAQASQSSAS